MAQLCELADLEGSNLISEAMVADIFENRGRGLALTLTDVVSQAAASLSKQTLHDTATSLPQSLDRFLDLVRSGAVEACGGDISKASTILGDDPTLLELITNNNAAKRTLALQRLVEKKTP